MDEKRSIWKQNIGCMPLIAGVGVLYLVWPVLSSLFYGDAPPHRPPVARAQKVATPQPKATPRDHYREALAFGAQREFEAAIKHLYLVGPKHKDYKLAQAKIPEYKAKAAAVERERKRKQLEAEIEKLPVEAVGHYLVYRPKDSDAWRFAPEIRFTPKFKNRSKKVVTGVQFESAFFDSFGEMIYSFSGQVEERIGPGRVSGTALTYQFEDNRFIDGEPFDKLLPSVQAKTAKVVTIPRSIAFQDGTVTHIK